MNSRYGVRRVTALTFPRGVAKPPILRNCTGPRKPSARTGRPLAQVRSGRLADLQPFPARMAAISMQNSRDACGDMGVSRAAETRMPRAPLAETGKNPAVERRVRRSFRGGRG